MTVQCRAKSEPRKIMTGERVDWSDLPMELCSIIGERLDRRIDVFRFRSVCRSWRSAIPLGRWPAYLGQRTFYTLQRLNIPAASTSNPAYVAADHKSWLIEVDESNSGTSRRIDPSKSHPLYCVSNLPIRSSVNLLDTRLVELSTSYRLRHNFAIRLRNRPEEERINTVRCGNHGVKKVVMVPNSVKNNNADDQVCSFFVLFDDGNLGLANCGDYSAPDEDLTLVGGGRKVECHDIVVFKGKLYFVDMWGAVWLIKYPSLELVQFCCPLYGFGSRMKRLVESCGALYLLNGYFTMMNSSVYNLNEGCGRWVRVKSLDDRAFVLFPDCSFSISALEVAGFRGSCIYFIQDDGIRVYSLDVHG